MHACMNICCAAPCLPFLLQTLAQKEALVGSWPGPGKQSAADAALPFFSGRPIRTTSSNLSSMSGVQHTSSFNGAHPGSARATMGMDNSFAAEQLCYNACNSAPITPRSPSFNGYNEEVSLSLQQQGVTASNWHRRASGCFQQLQG